MNTFYTHEESALLANNSDSYFKFLDLIERHAVSNPNAVAIVSPTQKLTYTELTYQANQLAQHLISVGVQRADKIGIYFERSVEIFVAILATLKVGAIYVPIDPSYPKSRIEHMLKKGDISILITNNPLLNALQVNISTVICLDQDWPIISKYAFTNIIDNFISESDLLAYILFTSGSTGAPKGVMINRSNLINAYMGWKKAYELTAQDVHLQMASFSFDVFSGDMVRALCSGGKLVLCPREILLKPATLYDFMKREQITCAEFVPAVLRKLADYLLDTQQDLSFMRLLICGSDNWSIGEYKKFKSICGKNTRLINSYGLTEATIDSAYFEMGDTIENGLLDEESVPIGKPFANTEIYLLDEDLIPVPEGKTAEMYIAGPSLAQGYLNQPELTNKKFIQHTLYGKSLRLYKTGDLARRLPDGNIQFLGRSDNQVKLHGHRIELADIENNLNQHPLITESLVTIQTDATNHKRLVAYIVCKADVAVDTKELRSFLKQHLPAYMLPSLYLPLDALPMLPNGKLDRQFFLTLPLNSSTANAVIFHNEIEKQIIKLLPDYISINIIDIEDSLIDLCMDSIMLANFASALNKKFKINIELCQLLSCKTVNALAKLIETNTIKINS